MGATVLIVNDTQGPRSARSFWAEWRLRAHCRVPTHWNLQPIGIFVSYIAAGIALSWGLGSENFCSRCKELGLMWPKWANPILRFCFDDNKFAAAWGHSQQIWLSKDDPEAQEFA